MGARDKAQEDLRKFKWHAKKNCRIYKRHIDREAQRERNLKILAKYPDHKNAALLEYLQRQSRTAGRKVKALQAELAGQRLMRLAGLRSLSKQAHEREEGLEKELQKLGSQICQLRDQNRLLMEETNYENLYTHKEAWAKEMKLQEFRYEQ